MKSIGLCAFTAVLGRKILVSLETLLVLFRDASQRSHGLDAGGAGEDAEGPRQRAKGMDRSGGLPTDD